MTTRYRCSYLITMAEDDAGVGVIVDAVLDVDGDTVTYAGPAAGAPPTESRGGSDEGAIALDGLVMPGFVNAHAHTPMVLLRGAGEGLPTIEWLHTVMWPRESRLTADDVAAAMTLGAAELLAGGITTTNEMYFFPAAMAAAARAAGLRAVIGGPLLESAAFTANSGSVAEQLDAIAALRRQWSDDALVDIAVAPHSAYALSESALSTVGEFVAAQAEAGDPIGVHIHLSEQPGEADAVTARTGLSATAYLDRLGVLTNRTVAAHGVWLDAADIAVLAERGTAVAHCPCSNGRHASGIAPVAALRAAGVTVGLGTDGPASHDRLDPFEELRTAIRFARIGGGDASLGDVAATLRMATAGSADLLGRHDLGRLTPGTRADFVELDVGALGFAPVLDPAELVGRVVWAGSPAAVRNVWVGGTSVVADGRCTTVDVAAATADVTTRATALAH